MQKGLLIKKACFAGVLAALLASSAMAGTSQWYFGGGLGGTMLDPDPGTSGITVTNDTDLGIKIFGGYDFTNNLTLEAFVADLGEAGLSNKDTVGYRLFGVSGLLYFKPSLPGPNAFLKAGIATLDNDSDQRFSQKNDTQAFVGIGAEFQYVSGISLRAEYEYFADDASMLSLSLLRRFGEVYVPPAPEVKIVEVETVPPVDGDEDGDGVPDSRDNCPGTLPGVAVDANGCDFDLDRDGVLNDVDQCPGTPIGIAVHDTGCPKFLGVLDGVHFHSDSADLTTSSKGVLRTIATQMNRYVALNVVIVGHTDSTASDTHNQKLSVNRAKSVADFLQSQGVRADRLRFVGYGERFPRATNKTEEGKRLNRRVELLPRK